MTRTIGVVVGIPEPWGSHLDQHRMASGDPLAPHIPAHLTLLGPTVVEATPAVTGAIDAHLAGVAGAHTPFRLGLAGTGTFRPVTQVVYVAVSAGVAECGALAADIRSGPLECTLPYPYHPHVTVAHDVSPAALDRVSESLATFEAGFAVDAFTLYEHQADGHWEPRRSYRLSLAPVGLGGGAGMTASEL